MASGVKQIGNTQTYERQPTGTLKLYADGSVEAVETFKGAYSKRMENLPVPLQKHPDFPSLKLYEFAGAKEEGEIYRYENIYKGVYAGIDLLTLMQTDVQMMTSNEPVETFWKFSYPYNSPPVTNTLLANIQAALDANVADITAVYPAITPATPAWQLWNLRRRGIDAYRMMNLTARLAYVQPTSNPPTAEFAIQVGTVPEAPTTALARAQDQGYVPKTTIRNYLFNGLSWRVAGGVISITEEHQLSGPNQWNSYLYDKSTQ